MKQLRNGFTGPSWDDGMVQKLGFIKKHLRYPISGSIALPISILAATFPGACILFFLAFTNHPNNNRPHWPQYLLAAGLLLAALIAGRRYWLTLTFKAVPTPYFNTDNQIILQRFLQSQHFAFARHPEAPEVYQIMSKNISTLKEEREIVVFIADDKRILINSHFTQTGSNFAIGIPHHVQMAGMLQRWLNAGSSNENRSLERSIF